MSCSICMEPILSGGDPYAGICGHVLHLECWRQCFDMSLTCPLCRSPNRPIDLRRLHISDSDDNLIASFVHHIDLLSSRITVMEKSIKIAEENVKIAEEKATLERNRNDPLRDLVLKLETQILDTERKLANALKDLERFHQKFHLTKEKLKSLEQKWKYSQKELEDPAQNCKEKESLQKQLATEVNAKTSAKHQFQALLKEVEGSNCWKSVLRRELATANKQLVDSLNFVTSEHQRLSFSTASTSYIKFVSKMEEQLVLLSRSINTIVKRLEPISTQPVPLVCDTPQLSGV